MTIGRPSSFNQDIANQIIDRLSAGEPMKRICADDDMPSYTTVLRWQDSNPSFRDLSTRAKQDGTHALADECLTIADDMQIDPQHKRIMVDTRIRLIGKWNKVDYGDKIAVEQSGMIATANVPYDALTDDQVKALATIPLPTR